jgi:hypothetical protein
MELQQQLKLIAMKTKVTLMITLVMGFVLFVSFQAGNGHPEAASNTSTTEMLLISPVTTDTIGSDCIINYPDPFCRATTIEYEITQATWVTLKVVCPNNQIDLLVFGNQAPGKYQVTYDACARPCGQFVAYLTTGYDSHQELMTKVQSHEKPNPSGD